jgi:hypothetical protein
MTASMRGREGKKRNSDADIITIKPPVLANYVF